MRGFVCMYSQENAYVYMYVLHAVIHACTHCAKQEKELQSALTCLTCIYTYMHAHSADDESADRVARGFDRLAQSVYIHIYAHTHTYIHT